MTQPPAADTAAIGGRRTFVVRARSSAPLEVVWPLVGEAKRWKEWSFLDRSELERTGAPDPDGVGALRRFSRLGVGSREEVVAWEPPRHLAYTIVSGMPVRSYRADVVLEPVGTGTAISWSVAFDERFSGTGSMLGLVLHSIITRFAKSLAAHADRLGREIAGPSV